ncbi:MAG: transglutaminase family protein [Acidobacteriaceae bacterium]|nr:transglutaminase family protein [Acidobacteriaceae bacterium]MBV9444143.1 transglutaminase family protein [Acidobacteriaceae bacterium]
MLIRLGYDISFDNPAPVAVVALLNVHCSRSSDLREPDRLQAEPEIAVDTYLDSFGNTCSRFLAPAGTIRLRNSTLIEDSGEPDAQNLEAREVPVEQLPTNVLRYLLGSRYCETDLLSNTAVELFGGLNPGWVRVQAICDWVHRKVTFGYNFARSTKTALDVYTERLGVCRDFQHLAIAFCRCLNIPARYVTGYLGDIGVPVAPYPMDFSAWFEAYLEDRWWTFDARHNQRRIGRVTMAVGRDAADVAITTSFGSSRLTKFEVVTEEVKEQVSFA